MFLHSFDCVAMRTWLLGWWVEKFSFRTNQVFVGTGASLTHHICPWQSPERTKAWNLSSLDLPFHPSASLSTTSEITHVKNRCNLSCSFGGNCEHLHTDCCKGVKAESESKSERQGTGRRVLWSEEGTYIFLCALLFGSLKDKRDACFKWICV